MRLFLKSCMGVLAALVLLALVLLVNTLRLPGLPASSARPAVPPADLDAAARRLSAAIRIATVSAGPDAPDAANNFPAFHQLLETSFPLTHAALKRETVNGDSLLYTWQGADPALPPMLLTAHMDTVPVEPGTEARWTYPPFSGAIAGGYVWGRGALDMKHAVMATLEGVEHLLAQGYRPRRTILLAFGADEEVGGAHGAAKIVELLQRRKVRAWFSLDEGSVILDGFIPGARRPIAQVGIAEKGYLSLALSAQADGGHSSMPPPLTAVGRIARAVARVEAQPMPASLDGPGGAGLRAMAPVLPFATRVALANEWLLGSTIVRQLAAAPATNALIRTSTAPTIISGGVKDNLLPAEARAVVNFRIAPGDSIAQVEAHTVAAIADPAVKVTQYGSAANEPTSVADIASPGYRAIAAALSGVAPDALLVPGLVVAGTDSRHYGAISDAALRFLPVRMTPSDVARIHGRNERISIANYGELIAFYEALMRRAD
jgi:carboxypeptidase PM20D1